MNDANGSFASRDELERPTLNAVITAYFEFGKGLVLKSLRGSITILSLQNSTKLW